MCNARCNISQESYGSCKYLLCGINFLIFPPSQTKDLIAEIELLEEEVTSREQHVLAMYRSIFDQCVSRPPSEQNSGVASPAHAHTKHESRKHPSIISSAFCSSKKFPLRPLQALISNNDLKNRIFGSSHATLSSGKGKVYFGKTCPDSTTKVGSIAKLAWLVARFICFCWE